MVAAFAFGALAFESEEALSTALRGAERTLNPGLGLGVCSPRAREILAKARRGPRSFVIAPTESFGFAELDGIGWRLWEVASGASSRGRLVIGHLGEQPSAEWPARPDEEWRGDQVGRPTTRWLVPSHAAMEAFSPRHIQEFVWSIQPGSSSVSRPALDVRDWAGFFGMLAECDERIYFTASEPDGEATWFEWAELSRPGVGGVIAFPHKELLVWTEVKPACELRLPIGVYPRAVEVVVWKTNSALSEYDLAVAERCGCVPGVSTPASSLWFAEGLGIIAVAATDQSHPSRASRAP